jgi:hypothetical protein
MRRRLLTRRRGLLGGTIGHGRDFWFAEHAL